MSSNDSLTDADFPNYSQTMTRKTQEQYDLIQLKELKLSLKETAVKNTLEALTWQCGRNDWILLMGMRPEGRCRCDSLGLHQTLQTGCLQMGDEQNVAQGLVLTPQKQAEALPSGSCDPSSISLPLESATEATCST